MRAVSCILMLLASESVFCKTDYGIHFENTSWPEIVAKAKAENKPIFVDAFTSWCGPCKWMEQQVYPTPKVGHYFNEHFVNAKFDMEKGEGKELATKYHVGVYPTYLFIDAAETLVHQFVGQMGSDQFLEHAAHALDPEKQYFTLLKKYEADRNNSDILEKLMWASLEANDLATAQKLAPKYLKSQVNWLDEKNLILIDRVTNTSNDTYFKFMREHKDEFGELFSPSDHDEKMFWTAYRGAQQKLKLPVAVSKQGASKSILQAENYFKSVFPEQYDKLIHQFRLDFFQLSNDWDAYAVEMIAYDPGQPRSANELNRIAWIFYEHVDNPDHLRKALEWAVESVTLDYSPVNTNTVAHLYFKLNNKPKAKEYANKSIEAAKLQDLDYSKTQFLLDEILGLK